jgi:hypothetical protein
MKLITKLITCLSLVAFAGCGSDLPPLAPLKGSVSLDGKPFANGSLMFSPSSGGRPSVAQTNEKGEFEAFYSMGVPGAILGKHTVMFEAGGSSEPLSEEDAMNLHKKNPKPPKNFKISPTEVDVQKGGAVVSFTLK